MENRAGLWTALPLALALETISEREEQRGSGEGRIRMSSQTGDSASQLPCLKVSEWLRTMEGVSLGEAGRWWQAISTLYRPVCMNKSP